MKIEGLISADEGQDEKSPKPKPPLHDMEILRSDKMDGSGVSTSSRKPRPERTVALTVSDNSAAEETIKQNLLREDGVYHCKICSFNKRDKTDVTRHIETHIDGLSYSCSVYLKTFRSRNSLNSHKSNYHKF